MVQIVADNASIESKLLDIINLTVENGAFYHSEIKIIAKDGDLMMESTLDPSSREPIIHLPEKCLPRIDDFDLNIEQGQFVLIPRDNHDTLHYELFSLIIQIFNLSNKIELHEQTFPLIVFKNHNDIIEHLVRGRSGSDEFYELYKSGDMERLTIDSYIGARHLDYPSAVNGKNNSVVLPIIDCVNHHTDAIPFRNDSLSPKGEKGLILRNSKPIEDSDECFARYNKADMFSSYLCYGFLDMSAAALRSIPLTIQVPTVGTITVFAHAYSRDALKSPAGFEDILYYFPDINIASKTNVEISHLVIPPGGAVYSLRRILEFLIKIMRPNLPNSKLKKLVLKCESQVLHHNVKYYKKLDKLLSTYIPDGVSDENINILNQLIKGQRKKISDYKNNITKFS